MGHKKKYSLEDLKALFNQNNCELLNTSYSTVTEKAMFVCRSHPDAGIQTHSFAASIYGGSFCKQCGYNRSKTKQLYDIPIEKLRADFAEKGLTLLESQYKGVKARYLCKCSVHENNVFEVIYDNLKTRKIKGCDICRGTEFSHQKAYPDSKIRQMVEDDELLFDHVERTGRYDAGTLVFFKCPIHLQKGIQVKRLNKLTQGQGCRFCNISKGESRICDYLSQQEIEYETQKTFEGLVGVGGLPLRYDFYLPKQNMLIEYQGVQHEHPVELFQKKRDAFSIQKEHDFRKKDYAKSHGFIFFEIWYTEFDNIENILQRQLEVCHAS